MVSEKVKSRKQEATGRLSRKRGKTRHTWCRHKKRLATRKSRLDAVVIVILYIYSAQAVKSLKANCLRQTGGTAEEANFSLKVKPQVLPARQDTRRAADSKLGVEV